MQDVPLANSPESAAREQPVLDSRGARGLFEQIAETTPDILYVYDVRMRRHVYINRRVHDLLGYAPEELASFGGDLTSKLTHPDDLPLLHAHFTGLADLGDNEIASVDHRMLHADGTYRWLSCRGTVFARGDDGRVSHVIGQVRDCTDQRRMVDALRESNSHLRAILDNVPALIWMAAVDGRCIDFNKPVLDFTGLTREELLGDGWSGAVHPDDRARCLETYRSHFNRRDTFRMEYRMRRADGVYRWIDDTGIPRFTAAGEFLGYIGCCVDVTNRRQAEQALRESEERFRAMADTVPDILYVTGRHRECLFINARFYEFTGLTPGSGLGVGWLQVVHPEDLAMATTAFRKSAPDVSVNELRVRAADGVYRWFVCRTRTLRDANGQVVRRFGVATDIDDLKRVQQELQHSNARLGAIIDSISDCYYTIDRDWRFTGMNAKAAEWLGVSAAEMIGRPYKSMLSAPNLYLYIRQAMDTGAPVRVEVESMVRPGRWGSVHIYPFAGGVNVFFRDISGRIRAERAERERHALLQSTIDALSAHVAVLDRDGTIVAVNAAWRRLAVANGYRGDNHGVGANYLLICDAALGVSTETAAVTSGLRTALEGGEMLRIEYPCASTNSSRWFQLRATRFGSGDQTRIVLAHEDVTEVKRAEHELRRLAGRLLVLQDEERRRIARELHEFDGPEPRGAGLQSRSPRAARARERGCEIHHHRRQPRPDRSLAEGAAHAVLSAASAGAGRCRPGAGDPEFHRRVQPAQRHQGRNEAARAHGAAAARRRERHLPRRAGGAGECAPPFGQHHGRRPAQPQPRARRARDRRSRGGDRRHDEGFAGGRCAFARGRDPRDASPAAPAQRRS